MFPLSLLFLSIWVCQSSDTWTMTVSLTSPKTIISPTNAVSLCVFSLKENCFHDESGRLVPFSKWEWCWVTWFWLPYFLHFYLTFKTPLSATIFSQKKNLRVGMASWKSPKVWFYKWGNGGLCERDRRREWMTEGRREGDIKGRMREKLHCDDLCHHCLPQAISYGNRKAFCPFLMLSYSNLGYMLILNLNHI